MSKAKSAYDVGYGKPPQERRWQRGQSGNPRGRKKKAAPPPTSDLQQAFYRALLTPQNVTQRGKQVQIRKYELLAEMMVDDALRGTSRERGALVQLMDKIGVLEGLRFAIEEATAEPYEPIFSEEDKRILAIIEDKVFGDGGEYAT